MGYVKMRATKKSKVKPSDFEKYKNQFILDVMTISTMEDIPKELIINWDHTGIIYIPLSSWTMEKEGATQVEVAGINNKRQLTAIFSNTMTGDFLPPQLIYAGKTTRCLPKSVTFRKDWHVNFSSNHWANEAATEDYINAILLPYVAKKKAELLLPIDQPALVIFDRFKAQCTEKILSLLDKNHIRITIVPAKCTDWPASAIGY
uniref:DDE-1 domain-containing protein n=1 Tax=Amphimedon queenslandica TaxID=400682 RepID=A0A1X7V0T9_AMPQE